MEAHNQDPSKRGAQHILASEFVEFIHGAPIARDMDRQVLALFGNGRPDVAPPPPKVKPEGPPEKYESRFKEFQNRAAGNKYAPQTNFANMTSIRVTLPRSLVVGRTFNKILHSAGLVASRSEGHRLILNNGALVGCRAEGPKPGKPMPDDLQFIPISQWHASETKNFIVDDDYMLLRVGKWKYKFVTIVSDEEFQRRGLDCPGWNSELGKPDDEVNAGNEQ